MRTLQSCRIGDALSEQKVVGLAPDCDECVATVRWFDSPTLLLNIDKTWN